MKGWEGGPSNQYTTEMIVDGYIVNINIVVWPTTSCFADWSKRRHVNFSIFDWPTLHDNLSCDIFTLRENVRWSDSLDGVSTQLIRMQTSYVTAPPAERGWTNATPFARLLLEVINN